MSELFGFLLFRIFFLEKVKSTKEKFLFSAFGDDKGRPKGK
jgi:hypothetical protein